MYKSNVSMKNIKLSSILTKSILDFNQEKEKKDLHKLLAISKITENSKNFTSVDLSKKEEGKINLEEKENKFKSKKKMNLISKLKEFSKTKISFEFPSKKKKRSKSFNKKKNKIKKK